MSAGVVLICAAGLAAAPLPPSNLTAQDHPNDAGEAVDLHWELSPDDRAGQSPRVIRGYEIGRWTPESPERKVVDDVPYGTRQFVDRSCVPDGVYFYDVVALGQGDDRSSAVSLAMPVKSVRQWFDRSRTWAAIAVAIVCAAVMFFTLLARRGRATYVREIAGLTAIHEAVGRATEMGRPCLFVPGSQDLNEVATVAGINLLSHVARIVAEYDSTLLVPTSRSLVMTAARESVQAACLAVGRPEAWDENSVYYVTDEQFAYVAHITGRMAREKPAACFYAGVFYAESLILAEAGSAAGALQIGGTSEAAQLPFMVAACDYTLIGEELFAASAYLSHDPGQLASLKGQDLGKLLAGAVLLVGCAMATLSQLSRLLGGGN